MNGQQGFNSTGIPQRPSTSKPKFNFNSKDVKKEITSDFLASQLASFGNSAKLKTLPVQNAAQNQPQNSQFVQPMYPMPGQNYQQPYLNQGLRQPMMAFTQGYGSQTMPPVMQNVQLQHSVPVSNQAFSSTGNMNFAANQFANQPIFNQSGMQPMHGLISSSNFQGIPQQFPNTAISPGLSNTPPSPAIENLSNTSVNSLQAIPSQKFSSTSSLNPPFSNLSTITPLQSNASKSFSGFQATSQQVATSQHMPQTNKKSCNDMFAFFNSKSSSQNRVESDYDPFSNLRQSSQRVDTKETTSLSKNSDITGFDAFSSFSQPSTISNNNMDLFGSKPFEPPSNRPSNKPTRESSHTPTDESIPASRPSQNVFEFGDNFNDLTSTLAVVPQNSQPLQVDMFGQSPFDATLSCSQSSSILPKPEPNLFARSQPAPSSDVQHDIFAFPSTQSATSSLNQSVQQKPQQVDLFGSDTVSSSLSIISKPLPISGDTKLPLSSSTDKYSVFSEVEQKVLSNYDDFGDIMDGTPGTSIKAHIGVPQYSTVKQSVSATPHQTAASLFSDSVEPVSRPSSEFHAFDAFAGSTNLPKNNEVMQGFDPFCSGQFQPETVASKEEPCSVANSVNSTVRGRPSGKTAHNMIVLPPPSKPTSTRKVIGAPILPSRPVAAASPVTPVPLAAPTTSVSSPFDPFGVQTGPTTESTQKSEMFDFDPFSTETDGAFASKPLTLKGSAPPPKPPPSYNRGAAGHTTGKTAGKKAPAPPARPSNKRPAPPPPTKTGQSNFYSSSPTESCEPSLLDLDLAPTTVSASATKNISQPLLILPSSDPRKPAGGPPGRPPPPKTADNNKYDAFSVSDPTTETSLFAGLPPPLPPRPSTGHTLYHYIVRTLPHAVALFDFEAENSDELDFKVGDVIKLEADISQDWYEGSAGSKMGIFPKNLVDVKISLTRGTVAPKDATPVPSPVQPAQQPAGNMFDAWKDEPTPSPPSPPPSPKQALPLTSSVFDTKLEHSVFDNTPNNNTTDTKSWFDSDKSVFDTDKSVFDSAPVVTEAEVKMCVALYDFDGEHEDELTFKEGDKIQVLGNTEEEWIEGKLGSRCGIFPKSFVSFSDQQAADIPPRPTTEELKAANITLEDTDGDVIDHIKKELGVYCDFVPEADDEIQLKEGDMIKILSVVDTDWLRGRLGDQEGIFPANFVPPVPESWNIPCDTDYMAEFGQTTSGESSDDTSEVTSIISETASITSEDHEPLGKVEVIADFDPENDFELELKKGDVVNITAKLDHTWLEGELNGNSGIFPSNFVKWLVGESSVAEPAFAANPIMSDRDMPKVLNREDTLKSLPVDTDLTPRADHTFSRHDTLKNMDPDATPRKQDEGMESPSFSRSNPFSAGDTTSAPPKSVYDAFADIHIDGSAAQLGGGEVSNYGEGSRSEGENQLLSPDNPFAKSSLEGFTSPFSAPDTNDPKNEPFASNNAEDPFASNVVNDQFALNDDDDPFASKGGNDPFASENGDDPFGKVNPFSGLSSSSTVPEDSGGVLFEMRALYEFEPDNEDELGFQEGDIIQVTEVLNEEWLKGNCKGKEGLFPATFAKRT